MNLHIYGKFPEQTNLLISVSGESYYLDSVESDIIIPLNEKGIYEIEVEMPLSENSIKWYNFLIFILTCFIQGLFHILLSNTDSDWYNRIVAYAPKAKFTLKIESDIDVLLCYEKSNYNYIVNKWRNPSFKIIPKIESVEIESSVIEFLPNYNDFKNKWFSYVKKIIAIESVVLALFIMLLCIFVINNEIFAIIITSGVIISSVILIIFLSIKEHKRLKTILNSFVKELKNSLE